MKTKTRILLYWWEIDSRPELLDPFHFPDSDLEIFHIWHMSAETRNAFVTPFHPIYWYDYKTPFELLKKINPDKIIVANGESLYEIALIMAAKSLGIPTYFMQHGIVIPLYFDRTEHIEVNRSLSKAAHYLKIIRFYLSVFWKVPSADRSKMLKLLPDHMYSSTFSALKKNIFSSRLPTKYICFTKFNAKYFRDRDNAKDEDILEIGIPFFDDIFKATAENAPGIKYVLLIDTIISESRQPVSEMNQYYQEINQYCLGKGCHLYIKLHPSAYNYTGLLEHPNISYLKRLPQSEMAAYARKAEMIFSFFSTMVFPLLFVNHRIVALNHEEHYFPSELLGEGKLKKIDIGKGKFEVNDDFEYDPTFLNEIRKKYLFSTDGKAKERLYQIIRN